MGKTVLMIEDDQDIQNYYDVVLSDLGLELLKAGDGQEALTLLDNGINPDLIILDLVMPVMDGEKFLRELRLVRKSDIPIIISTVDEVAAARLTTVAKVQGVFFKLRKIDEFRSMIDKVLQINHH